MADVAIIIGAPLPGPVQLSPPNHVVVLLHWDFLARFLAHASAWCQKQIEDLQPPVTLPHQMTVRISRPIAIDAHMHLKGFLPGPEYPRYLPSASWDWFQKPDFTTRGQAPILEAMVDNRCFPSGWSLPWATEVAHGVEDKHTRILTTYGIHPRIAAQRLDWCQVERLINSPSCVAVGECSLDYTEDHSSLPSQTEVFERLLHLADHEGKPVVVHIRTEM